jgi:hypothetical protein
MLVQLAIKTLALRLRHSRALDPKLSLLLFSLPLRKHLRFYLTGQQNGHFFNSLLGMLLALTQNNLASSKKLVGFDASPALVEGLKRGEIQALVAQNPKKMGREAVRALVAKIKGEIVPPIIDSGAAVVTRGNLETPEIQTLLVKSKDIQWSWVSTTAALKELVQCNR